MLLAYTGHVWCSYTMIKDGHTIRSYYSHIPYECTYLHTHAHIVLFWMASKREPRNLKSRPWPFGHVVGPVPRETRGYDWYLTTIWTLAAVASALFFINTCGIGSCSCWTPIRGRCILHSNRIHLVANRVFLHLVNVLDNIFPANRVRKPWYIFAAGVLILGEATQDCLAEAHDMALTGPSQFTNSTSIGVPPTNLTV